MANQEHVDIVLQGVRAIEQWREEFPNLPFDLSGSDLSNADLSQSDLSGSDIRNAMLNNCDLFETDLTNAALNNTELIGSLLNQTTLDRADLSQAKLAYSVFDAALLWRTNFKWAELHATVFAECDLSTTLNLESCEHVYKSTIGTNTIIESEGKIPEEFLRGCGVNPVIQRILVGSNSTKTDAFYEWLESPFKLDTCFISYSTADKRFVERLRKGLNARGVDYWYAPEHGRWGRDLESQIDRQISLRDRIVLVCSQSSLNESEWVQREIDMAVREERRRKKTMLFPVMLDDTFLKWANPHAKRLRKILAGDFRGATRGEAFEAAIDRLFKALYQDDERLSAE